MPPSLGTNATRGFQGFRIVIALAKADNLTVLQRDNVKLDMVFAVLALGSDGVREH